jgi:outer membrane protein assembly factor BamB
MSKIVATFFALSMVYAGAFSQGAPIASEAKAIDGASSFKKCWEYHFENTVKQAIASTNGTIYLSEPGGKVRAISAKSGQVLWMTELGGEISASLAIPKVGLAVVTSKSTSPGEKAANSTLRLLNFDSGLVRFSAPIAVAGEIFLGRSGSRIVLVDTIGNIIALDMATGSPVWTNKLASGVKVRPAFRDRTIAVATIGNKIEIISPTTGQIRGSIKTEHPVSAVIFGENESIVAGDDRGNVVNYRDASGAVGWRFKSGAKIGTIVESDQGILVGSYDNFLYLISNYSGDVKWKRRMGSRLVNAPFVSEGRLFLTVSVEDTAVSIDLENGKVIDQIALGEDKYAISSPVLTEGSMLVFSVPEALVAYSNFPCVSK